MEPFALKPAYQWLLAAGLLVLLITLASLQYRWLDEVSRADTVVKRLNTFAHSPDKPLASIDLQRLLESVEALSQRLASMKSVGLEVRPPAEPMTLQSNPFLLHPIEIIKESYTNY